MLSAISLAAAPLTSKNPFATDAYYVNPSYQKELDSSIATETDATIKKTLQSMRSVPSAYWIDKADKITGNTTDTLEGILRDAASVRPAPLVVVIFYDLPNRDCDAKASNGEICCYTNADGSCDYGKSGDCADGLARYKSQYVDPFAAVLKQYHATVPIAVIIEPDSLPNLATNAGNPHCGNSATRAAYTQGISYAVTKLATAAPSAALYLDAAHGGWLGWDNNAQSFAALVKSLNVATHLRGMSSNVANYQTLGVACPASAFANKLPLYCQQNKTDPCCADPCKMLSQWSSGNNELNYVQAMSSHLTSAIPGFKPKWVIDTGRDGAPEGRQSCSDWCNIRGAGVGALPTSNVPVPSVVDAYYWLKTPGESDGCTQQLPDGSQCARYDSMCASPDSIGTQGGEPRCPEAGLWFDYQIKQLAKNAHMGPAPPPSPVEATLEAAPAPDRCTTPAYAQCGGRGIGDDLCCPDEHACEGGEALRLCMPTAEKQSRAGHNGLFATALEHARERLRRAATEAA